MYYGQEVDQIENLIQDRKIGRYFHTESKQSTKSLHFGRDFITLIKVSLEDIKIIIFQLKGINKHNPKM